MADDKKVIFSMSKVSKTYSSNNKQVLKDIYLSFFYGAKIGILGLNGSGKSTLLRIIAGLAIFLGMHFIHILAPDWRAPQMARGGEKAR